jgi:hypothetical protein
VSAALGELLEMRELMGHKSSLSIDACNGFSTKVVTLFLIEEGFESIEEALICHEHERESLWAALEAFRHEYDEKTQASGVGV